jgi:hypothetical protein
VLSGVRWTRDPDRGGRAPVLGGDDAIAAGALTMSLRVGPARSERMQRAPSVGVQRKIAIEALGVAVWTRGGA